MYTNVLGCASVLSVSTTSTYTYTHIGRNILRSTWMITNGFFLNINIVYVEGYLLSLF